MTLHIFESICSTNLYSNMLCDKKIEFVEVDLNGIVRL